MEEYYFLFSLAFVYSLIASVQDLKTREVANWVNFSFAAFALVYRVFYALFFNDFKFFFLGLLGFGMFFALANAFYYTKVFAGGDAKLFMGFGAILPFSGYTDLIFFGAGFVFLLFTVGAAYSLAYSLFLVFNNLEKFKKEFSIKIKQKKLLFAWSAILAILLLMESLIGGFNIFLWAIFSVFLFSFSLLYIYLKALEGSCLIKLVSPSKLTEGDWLEKDVRFGGRTIKKSVHGLSYDEINILKKAGKKVWVKYGIPFVPAFLIALIIMVFFSVVLKQDFQNFLMSLF